MSTHSYCGWKHHKHHQDGMENDKDQDKDNQIVDLTLESVNRVLTDFSLPDFRVANAGGLVLPAPSSWSEIEGKMLKQVADPPSDNDARLIEALLETLQCEMTIFLEKTKAAKPAKYDNNLTAGLNALENGKKLFWDAREPYHTLPYFPRFFTLTLAIMQSATTTGLLTSRSQEVAQFAHEAQAYLRNVTDSAFHMRQSDISMRLTGPNKELAYLHDRHTDRSLTEWVTINAENADLLHQASVMLRQRIARLYIESLPLGAAYLAVAEILPWAENENYEQYLSVFLAMNIHEFPGDPEDTAVPENVGGDSRGFARLLLPSTISRYCPDLAPPDTRMGLEIAGKLVNDVPIRWAATFLLSFSNGKHLRYTANIAAGVMGALIGPLAGILIDLFLPTEQLTMEGILAEVKTLIGESISDYEANKMAKLLEQSDHAKNQLAAAIEDKDDRLIGQKSAIFLQETFNLEAHYFTPYEELEKNNIHYKMASLFIPAMTLRFSALTASLKQAKEAGNVNTVTEILKSYEQFLLASYNYLDKLFSAAWDRQGYRGIRVESTNHMINSNRRHWILDFVTGRTLSATYQGKYSDEVVNNYAVPQYAYPGTVLDERTRFFATQSTSIRNACDLHDVITKKYNEICGKDLPLAGRKYKQNLDWKIYQMTLDWKKWKQQWVYAQSDNIWFWLNRFGTNAGSNPGDPGYEDDAVKIYDANENFLLATGVGLCGDMHAAIQHATGRDIRKIKISMPWGIRAESMDKESGPKYLHPSADKLGNKYHSFTIVPKQTFTFFIDLEFYFELDALAHFTTAKGRAGVPIV